MRHIAPKPFSWKLPNSVGFRYGRERRSQAKNCRKCQDNAARGRKNRSASRQDSETRRKSIPRASSRSREARPPRLSGREHRAPARSPDRGTATSIVAAIAYKSAIAYRAAARSTRKPRIEKSALVSVSLSRHWSRLSFALTHSCRRLSSASQSRLTLSSGWPRPLRGSRLHSSSTSQI